MAAQIGPPTAAIRAHEELFAYWRSLCEDTPAPPRRRIDPAHMKRLLPTVSLIDVARRDPMDFRIRLAGTGLYGVYGGEITGKSLSDIYSTSAADYWRGELDKVVSDRKPGVGVHSLAWRGASHLSILWIRLPLATDSDDVGMILGYDAVVGYGASAAPSGIRPAA
jgi:hypothetical protein